MYVVRIYTVVCPKAHHKILKLYSRVHVNLQNLTNDS